MATMARTVPERLRTFNPTKIPHVEAIRDGAGEFFLVSGNPLVYACTASLILNSGSWIET